MKTTSTRGIERTRGPARITKPRKAGRKRKASYLKRPELSFVDRLLRSFDQVAPEAWIPIPYLALLQRRRSKNRKTLH